MRSTARLLPLCALALALASLPARADDAPAAAAPAASERPENGMKMSDVEARYGAPTARYPAVGQPPELGGFLRQIPSDELGTCEFLGGVLLALGLLTRPVALLFMLEWIVIAAAVPVKAGQSWFTFGATPHHPALIAVLCLALLLRGGGPYSLDRRIGREF